MADLTEAELIKIYFDYLSSRGVSASRIPASSAKTPDLRLTKDGQEYLNEFKSPELLLDEQTQLFLFKTTNTKILSFIHKAVKQLHSHDPLHEYPWIVTFAATHFQLNQSNFCDALRGGFEVADGSFAPPGFAKTEAFKRSLKNRFECELFIWLQISASPAHVFQVTFIVNGQSRLRGLTESLVSHLRTNPVSNMDLCLLMV